MFALKYHKNWCLLGFLESLPLIFAQGKFVIMGLQSPYFELLRREVAKFGGFHNAHLHLDRINTLDDGYVDHGRVQVLESSSISLQKKHALLNTVHEGMAYDPENMLARLKAGTDVMIASNTRIADTMVDVTADRVQLSALETVQKFAKSVADKITIRAAAYSPLGFKDSQPERWEIYEQGARLAEFLGCLPEADDTDHYPENIGFDEHCSRMLDLARRENKMLHVHTDQLNEPSDNDTERLIEIMRRESGPTSKNGAPMVWAVHMISPSRYDDMRFAKFVDGLLECNIGVISCPSAAIGMRQLRSVSGPTYNSIPRILELAAAGVHIRLGSDNVADMCSPSATADLMDEVFVLSGAIRFYQPRILAKLAAGVHLDANDRTEISDHLKRNEFEIRKVLGAAGQHIQAAQ